MKLTCQVEIDAPSFEEAQRIFDRFRESVLPGENYGVTLYGLAQADDPDTPEEGDDGGEFGADLDDEFEEDE